MFYLTFQHREVKYQTREGVFYLISKHWEVKYQTREGVFRLIYKHWEVILRKKREGVSHPIPNHWLVTRSVLSDVTCFVFLHTLLHVVGCCWELLRKVWNCSNFKLRANGRNNSQQCWEFLARMSRPFVRGFSMRSGVHSFFFFLECERKRMDVEKGRNDRLNAS